MPDARIEVLDGQQHVADVLAPDVFAEHVIAFLDRGTDDRDRPYVSTSFAMERVTAAPRVGSWQKVCLASVGVALLKLWVLRR